MQREIIEITSSVTRHETHEFADNNYEAFRQAVDIALTDGWSQHKLTADSNIEGLLVATPSGTTCEVMGTPTLHKAFSCVSSTDVFTVQLKYKGVGGSDVTLKIRRRIVV